MTTEYDDRCVRPMKFALCALLFLMMGGGALWWTHSVYAQGEPTVAPAQSDSPDILGGREAQPGAWPWQVALLNRMEPNQFLAQFCGGTLIAEDWVLTAAHCVWGAEPSLIDVLVGAHRLSEGGQRVRISQIIPYRDYDPRKKEGDLALIRLSTPVTYTPIALYTAGPGETEFDYLRGTVIGWGAKEMSVFPDALREVALPLVEHEKCARNLYWENPITDRMICAGYETLTMGACYGDSGGPLMVQRADASWVQIGIVSWGPPGCIDVGRYNVFTRVSKFTDWITTCMSRPDALPCRGGDVFEPDNGPDTAQPLDGPISAQMHTFHEMGDQDWVRLNVKEGEKYLFLTARMTETVPFLRTVIWLFGEDGRTPITYTETPPDFRWWGSWEETTAQTSAHLVWKANRTGPIYASIELLPDFFGQVYGPNTRYWLTVGGFYEIFMPLMYGPEPKSAGSAGPGRSRRPDPMSDVHSLGGSVAPSGVSFLQSHI
ncbi:MAG: serine protease [Caldilinea sp.]|nr:serine protease [Caldilinea sp.]MDW8442002.1 serine protease [Caldilineaceae bacterium]